MIDRLPYVYVRGEYEKLERLVEDEISELTQAGYDTDHVAGQLEEYRGSQNSAEMRRIFDSLGQLGLKPGYPYIEPSDYESIVASREGAPADGRVPPQWNDPPAGDALYDRLYGAWLGRCAGNCLGRPVENWTHEQIKVRLDLTGDYPLSDYFPVVDPLPESTPDWLAGKLEGSAQNRDLRPNINGMVRDDDTDFTIIGLHVLERHGRDFSTRDVGNAWLNLFPFRSVHMAARVAYINMVNNLEPPETGLLANPYREDIGAQIRADMWGFVNPGNPKAAAEMSFRDAALSHTANGIYGEMAAAAMIAASFVTDEPEEIISAGVSVIPGRSRLAETLNNVVAWTKQSPDWKTALERIDDAFETHHPVHTLPNAAVVALALLCGNGEFERSIAISVMAGYDTDCNGATVGSILGAMRGAGALPDKWVDPLDDRLASQVAGYDQSRISDLAKRTQALVST